MKLAIMQPYFMPYIGYFQLIASVDEFILYDNIKYTKKGWINRNRILQNGKDVTFSLPLKKGSDSLNVCERELAVDFSPDKLLNQFKGAYNNAPYFKPTFLLLKEILLYGDQNLFGFLYNSILKTCEHLEINTELKISSDITIDHNLKSQDKVLAYCMAAGADSYINPIGGVDLYSKSTFSEKGIELNFIKSKLVEYQQFGGDFVPWLSIVDVLMFNSVDTIQTHIKTNHEII